MSTADTNALEPIFRTADAGNAIWSDGAAPVQASAIEPWTTASPGSQLQGPSTLTLALIGAATLAAYRAIENRITGGADVGARGRAPRFPRRRAA